LGLTGCLLPLATPCAKPQLGPLSSFCGPPRVFLASSPRRREYHLVSCGVRKIHCGPEHVPWLDFEAAQVKQVNRLDMNTYFMYKLAIKKPVMRNLTTAGSCSVEEKTMFSYFPFTFHSFIHMTSSHSAYRKEKQERRQLVRRETHFLSHPSFLHKATCSWSPVLPLSPSPLCCGGISNAVALAVCIDCEFQLWRVESLVCRVQGTSSGGAGRNRHVQVY